MAWEPTQAEKSVKPDGTSYRITHDDGRYGTIRFRNDRAIVISVGPRLYTLDGWWNNEPGHTSLTLIPRPAHGTGGMHGRSLERRRRHHLTGVPGWRSE